MVTLKNNTPVGLTWARLPEIHSVCDSGYGYGEGFSLDARRIMIFKMKTRNQELLFNLI